MIRHEAKAYNVHQRFVRSPTSNMLANCSVDIESRVETIEFKEAVNKPGIIRIAHENFTFFYATVIDMVKMIVCECWSWHIHKCSKSDSEQG